MVDGLDIISWRIKLERERLNNAASAQNVRPQQPTQKMVVDYDFDLDTILAAREGLRGDDQQRIAVIGVEWVALLLKKNADYGSSAWKAPVLAPTLDARMAMLVRMSDKIERLRHLLSGESVQVADESINDTIRDLGAYCLLLLAKPSHPTHEQAESSNG